MHTYTQHLWIHLSPSGDRMSETRIRFSPITGRGPVFTRPFLTDIKKTLRAPQSGCTRDHDVRNVFGVERGKKPFEIRVRRRSRSIWHVFIFIFAVLFCFHLILALLGPSFAKRLKCNVFFNFILPSRNPNFNVTHATPSWSKGIACNSKLKHIFVYSGPLQLWLIRRMTLSPLFNRSESTNCVPLDSND